ncbi:Primosomal protein N' [Usitatibacter rugosus]|uniref:Replication restart protein PriA n=1 Tax=Usitatibacter rugosus TaxID=2732067 RepID=A0A6M4H226_9PROT|nr:primosomal protein N' [Usitatibacter rugosus]QJR13148.1 Primosomal protein N' [Usitatibacter rugosus]
MKVAQVALDVPLEGTFDFRVPEGLEPRVGSLVVVPFGRTRKVGVVVGGADRSEVPDDKLRDLERVLEDVPAIAPPELELYRFCAAYYLRPLGEVIGASLPPRLRQVSRRPLKPPPPPGPLDVGDPSPVALTGDQARAVELIGEGAGRFHPVLLQGVTGSGKTEVYLRAIAAVLERGRQALFLVPEIGLTPQLEARVRGRFPRSAVVSAHSHLSEGERAKAWLAAHTGSAAIVLGTRLAVLSPFANLGLIVVDEEHDMSFKQQEGLRYSARDVAVRRAQMLGIPVVLGSATPSLASYANAKQGRYALAVLRERATAGASMPVVRNIDTRADRPEEGLSSFLVGAIRKRLERGEQSLIFVNRRGFSPVLYCRDCAWTSSCDRCSAKLVLHRRTHRLRCHHCGHERPIPQRCPQCGGMDLQPVGHGTQRVEEALKALFPAARIARVDRDSTARKGALAGVLERVGAGEVDILVGTQMLAKGHDYPALTLVGVLDSDSGLFSADFRASERLFSQLVQVAGRAGRADRPGEVLIQTDFPTHPLYAAVATHDYETFADEGLEERRMAGFPPFSHLVLLRAESKKPGEAVDFLRGAARLARELSAEVEVFDPVPAPLERKAGYIRAQLLVRAQSRSVLQPLARDWKSRLDELGERHVRWSLDIDPQDV